MLVKSLGVNKGLEKADQRVPKYDILEEQKFLIYQQQLVIKCIVEKLRAHQSALRIQKLQHRFRYVYLPSTALFLLVLLIISLGVFWSKIFPKRFQFQPVNSKTEYFINDHPVYNRSNWGALDPEGEFSELPLPSSLVIISHSGTEPCTDFTQCANITQAIQFEHIKKGFGDINFNFLIGGEGGIYVGRGWQYENTIRFKSVVISFIGDFSKGYATDKAINASLDLIGEGVRQGKIREDYKLIGENQTSAQRFYSPGYHMVEVIKKFNHYFPGTML
ncbi:peptidoglycan-recognition protein SB2-like isoform X4 [Anthonomus grandis grandis]|uniref:peptidoglycan-recognition protein SB2-like isoform X4 n=1 Tax=Anthonomus grandis grandis TaxID=2921223 RepID=UPI002166AC09|nr:peptidoglycan-recognition protein SB2-like isoform X4 [Anthonomus grandis grandis]